jgi:hypothetical protein
MRFAGGHGRSAGPARDRDGGVAGATCAGEVGVAACGASRSLTSRLGLVGRRLDAEQGGDGRRPACVLADGCEQLLTGLGGDPRRDHRAPHRRVGDGVEHGGPAIRRDVGGQGAVGGLGEPGGELCGERRPRLGRTGREAQGAHDPAVLQRALHVGEPPGLLRLRALLERRLELGCQLTGRLVPSHVVCAGDHGAQVPQRELLAGGPGRLGPVEPVGHPGTGDELLGDAEHGVDRDGQAALGLGLGVLLLERSTHRRHAAPQQLLGDRLLLG